MTKKVMRNQVLALMNNMNRDEHKELSLAIVNRLIQTAEFHDAETIGLTLSRFPEVDTRPLIEAAWEAGKRVTVPKCIKETRDMDFRLITSYTHLETVYMDLLEPIVVETVAVEKDSIDLQIVPGVVFSNEGYRIGFGGGYYDRYLADYNGHRLSLAFDCQINGLVPVKSHDIPVHKIITVTGEIVCQENEV
ncbi:5-formyltetrahydrofolate cyclo-ligase [Sporosarcina beigongshangi]|uniref:5-formyltetrahydrofolate cyclo-ligase n=1 Tax=Sporosarcina beigongshangi TaxID=2782538 RepID=UPI001939DF20|nr:5-formyltetrahydrofolate cyclo-ligase [Sporosarcina beigongshangi]